MTTRRIFTEELNQVKKEIEQFATDAKEVLDKAVTALFNRDVKAAQEILDNDHYFNQKEQAINESVIILIAKQQPVATDLRRLIIAIKISSDLERMADHAKNIAKSTLRLGPDHNLEIPEKIRNMADLALEMLDIAYKAYDVEDVSLANKLSEKDDVIDNKYGEVVKELLEETAYKPEQIQYIMQMAYTSRYIERFADHITNIGESIFYMVKGVSYDLND